MNTLSFQAPEKMAKQLEKFAREMDRSKGYLLRQALAEYLEDLQDYMAAKRAQASYDPSETYSLEEMKQRYKLR